MRISDVIAHFEDFAPLGLAEDWDSVGLQVGDPQQECNTVAIALDLTRTTLEEAMARQAELIIVHHPLLFRPPKAIRFDQSHGELIQKLCAEKISLYAAHTNLDSTAGGLNDHLADAIELTDRRPLLAPPSTTPNSFQDKLVGLGRVGRLKQSQSLKELAGFMQEKFQPEALRLIGKDDQIIERVALCTGSGGSLVHDAIQSDADCYITGDVKYHQALDAEAAGMAILDVGHYATEISCIPIIQDVLSQACGDQIKIVSLETGRDPLRAYRV